MLTTTLRNGRTVLAKTERGMLLPKTFANATQANRAAEQLRAVGIDATVYQSPLSRVRFVQIGGAR